MPTARAVRVFRPESVVSDDDHLSSGDFIIRAATLLGVTIALLAAGGAQAASPDLVVADAKIYTVDKARPEAGGMAVRDGKIVYVGTTEGALALAGPATKVVRLGGRRVLPGLVDSHIHPLASPNFDTCDLNSRPMRLAEIADFVKSCLAKDRPAPGEWLKVAQWNFASGNQPDAAFPSLRVALDSAAPDNPVVLVGNDGHHDAFNSAALKLARNSKGEVVGFSAKTLGTDFVGFAHLIAVDVNGEPSGGVTEYARAALGRGTLADDRTALMKDPEAVVRAMNSGGVTAVVDAMVAPQSLAIYDALYQRGRMTMRASLAQFFFPENYRKPDGAIDYDRLVDMAVETRAKYAGNPLIRADTIKLFADGVLEGNPLETPPTPPNALTLRPMLQPIFGKDDQGRATFKGYADPDSPACRQFMAGADAASPQAVSAFLTANGFHPAQCKEAKGRLEHEPSVILEYVRRMHQAGFAMHVHAVSDAAVKTTLDAIEASRRASPPRTWRDTLTHLQLVAPADVARMGRDHIYANMTLSWAVTRSEYDLSVIPFINRVKDGSFESLHDPKSYYEQNAYPAKAIIKAGAILTAGSDAPVNYREPRPFTNMQVAVTRAIPGSPPLSPWQRITIEEEIAAYTINGARQMGWDSEIGSLETGKSADFIVLDRDPLTIDPGAISETKVDQTWFKGELVYSRAEGASQESSGRH